MELETAKIFTATGSVNYKSPPGHPLVSKEKQIEIIDEVVVNYQQSTIHFTYICQISLSTV